MTKRMDVRHFKELVRKGAAPAAAVLVKSVPVLVEPDEGRRKLFTISTAAIDREKDMILQEGWELDHYRMNPVVLWAHDTRGPPIGKTIDIGVVDGALKAQVEFVPADMPLVGELADMAFRMCDLGFLSACSVGFIPLDYETAKDRMGDDDWWPPMNFTRSTLMEWSIVTIPANPEAVIDPRAAGDDVARDKQLALAQAAADAAALAIKRDNTRRRALARAYG